MRYLAAALVFLACASAARAHVRCAGEGCGDEFIAQGWSKIAECPGHNWSYLLRKGTSVVVCRGVSGRAGPVEFPCQIVREDIAKLPLDAALRCDRG